LLVDSVESMMMHELANPKKERYLYACKAGALCHKRIGTCQNRW
jgi:hypothetical protein